MAKIARLRQPENRNDFLKRRKNNFQPRAFTLVEMVIILLATAIIFGLFIKYTSLNQNFLKLNRKIITLTNNLQTASHLSFESVTLVGNQTVCGIGLIFTTSSYQVVGYATSTINCASVASSSFNLLSTGATYLDLTSGLSFVPHDSFPSSTLLENDFNGVSLTIATSSLAQPISFNRFEAIFTSPYGRPLLFKDGLAMPFGGNSQNLFLGLSLNNNTSSVRITGIGQVILNQ